jgi:oligoendopeptidase F
MVDNYSWRLDDLYKSDTEFEKKRGEIEAANYRFINKWRVRKDYLTKPAVLKEALDEYDFILRNYGTDGDEGYYYWLRSQLDQTDPEIKAKVNKIEDFSNRIQNDIQFFYLNICKIPKRLQQSFLSYKGLRPYRHFLERAFRESRYLLSDKEERVINLKNAPAYSYWIRMTSSFLSKEERLVLNDKGEKEKKTFAEIMALINHKKKPIRDRAAEALNDILRCNVDISECELNSILQNKKVDDELRKVPRPDLPRHISDDIDSHIVDTLIETVAEGFQLSARYYKLKAKLLGVKRLKYHERNVEYGNIDRKYPFKDSVRLVNKVLRDLDSEFSDILETFLREGRFDVLPRKGKVSGAFCAHHLITQPTYILLNHNERFDDVLTLAHELGHGINNELIKRRQRAINFGTPLSTAEVASTFMEDFVLKEIIKDADDHTRLAIMMKKLNDDVSTIFRQVACYRFEQELHSSFRQSGYLSKDKVGEIFQRHMASYMGDYVEQSEGSQNWWVYWGHIRTFFYVYSYASGLIISKSLQQAVQEDRAYISKVKDFLSAGLSESPRALFKGLGIDIESKAFWQKGMHEVETLLNDTETLAKRLRLI